MTQPAPTARRFDFRQLGFRVPALVIGPTVRRGQVVSSTFEHVSIAATLRARFGIESLGARMDAAADLSACIDPELVGLPAGPLARLPELTLDRRRVEEVSFLFTSQPGLDEAVRGGHVPSRLIDTRAPEDRLRSLLRHVQDFEGSVHAVAENALDVPHTAFVHRGLFRSGGEKRSIDVDVRRYPDRIEAEYIASSRAPLTYCVSRGPGTLEMTRLPLSTLCPNCVLAASTCGIIDSSV